MSCNHLCSKCKCPFEGLETDLCPNCRNGALEFINLGPGIFGADSPKMGTSRRYVIVRQPDIGAFYVHIGLSPVHRNGKPFAFGSLHESKIWCKDFESRLEKEGG
jgi:hypothetical protein